MTAKEIVRQHIDSLPDDQLFTTRSMLRLLPKRRTLDNALWEMVRDGEINRQTPGVFSKSTCERKFSVLEIAIVKAKAFYRDIVENAEAVAAKLKLITVEHNQVCFAISGNSSSFKCTVSGVRVHLKRISGREMRMGDNPVGKVLRAFWHLRRAFTEKYFQEKFPVILGPEMRHADRFRDSVPHWLSDAIARIASGAIGGSTESESRPAQRRSSNTLFL